MTTNKHTSFGGNVLALLLSAAMLFSMSSCQTLAYAEDTGQPETIITTPSDSQEPEIIDPTTAPTVKPKRPVYTIRVEAPAAWTSEKSVDVTITVTDNLYEGFAMAEVKLGSKPWQNISNSFDQNGKAVYKATENGTLTIRITDANGNETTQEAAISCFDRVAPVVNAGVIGNSLHVTASDAQSGLAGIQVNSMLFTTMSNGVLEVPLTEALSKYEKLAVRAFDFAGVFSDPVTIDNPCYVAPATPSPVPTKTPKPTSSGSTSGSSPSNTASAPTATPYLAPVVTDQQSSVYFPSPVFTAAAPTATPIIQTEYITIGPGMPYYADGNSHTLDVLYSAATNKQFITLQTKSGNTFYLVIDYDKPIDEAGDMYETHFLNLVDERDLLALMSDEEKEEVPTPTPQIVYVTPEPTKVPAATNTPDPTPVEPQTEKNPMMAMITLVGILAAGGIGAFVFLKGKNGNKKPSNSEFDDLDDDDEEDSEETDSEH